MFFLPQGANNQCNSTKETNPMKKFDNKISFPNPYDENPNQEHKTLQNIIQGSKIMKIIYNYLRNINGMKNHSNWLDFDVKILKEGFKRGWERFKTRDRKSVV